MDQTFRTLNSSPLSEFVDQNVEDFITSQRHLHVRLDSVAQTIFDENSEAMRLSKLGTPAWGEFSASPLRQLSGLFLTTLRFSGSYAEARALLLRSASLAEDQKGKGLPCSKGTSWTELGALCLNNLGCAAKRCLQIDPPSPPPAPPAPASFRERWHRLETSLLPDLLRPNPNPNILRLSSRRAGRGDQALEALYLALRIEEKSAGLRAQGETHMNIGLTLYELGRNVEATTPSTAQTYAAAAAISLSRLCGADPLLWCLYSLNVTYYGLDATQYQH